MGFCVGLWVALLSAAKTVSIVYGWFFTDIYLKCPCLQGAVARCWPVTCDLWPHLDQFGKGLIDENEGDEEGEDLLSETGDKANQDASLEGHRKENDEHKPETDPHSSCQILDPVVFTKLHMNTC